MKKIKTILIIILILAVIIFGIIKIVKSRLEGFDNVNDIYANEIFMNYTVRKQDITSYVKGTGIITSFNIENLEIETGNKVSEILVSEGQKVEAKQDILKIVNDEGKVKTIKSTISGMFFCIEDPMLGTKYCIYNLDDIGVKLALAEKDITSVNIGQKVTVEITALNKVLEGTVSYVSSLPQNDKFIVKVKLNYSDDIKFGYTTIASILTLQKNDVIAIPYNYLKMSDDGRYYVYKEEKKEELFNCWQYGNKIEENLRSYIEVGTITSTNVEVLVGLNEGEKILDLIW